MLLATFAALSNAPPTIQCPNGTVYMEVNKAFSFSGAYSVLYGAQGVKNMSEVVNCSGASTAREVAEDDRADKQLTFDGLRGLLADAGKQGASRLRVDLKGEVLEAEFHAPQPASPEGNSCGACLPSPSGSALPRSELSKVIECGRSHVPESARSSLDVESLLRLVDGNGDGLARCEVAPLAPHLLAASSRGNGDLLSRVKDVLSCRCS